MTEIAFDILPDIPQRPQLEQIVQNLAARDEVQAVWIGGSIARGTADEYSDVDLRVALIPEALEAWRTPDLNILFNGQVVGQDFLALWDSYLHHLVLADGDIYDLLIQNKERTIDPDLHLILFCKDPDIKAKLDAANHLATKPQEEAPTPETLRELIETFWINSHKHRKVLHRGLYLLANTGIEAERKTLLRLYYILATGQDTGKHSQTIHSLTHIVRAVQNHFGDKALHVLGTPCDTPDALHKTIETLRDEMTRIGQELAVKFAFEYPHHLEQTVREGWTQYQSRETRG